MAHSRIVSCRSSFAVVLASVAALFVGGCATASSAGMPTNKIKPAFEVKVDAMPSAPGTFVSAVLNQDGSLSRVLLAPGDTLAASSDKDAQIALAYDGTLQIFTATLDKVTDRATLSFALSRAAGGQGGTATVQLPAPLALTAPTPNQQVSYAGGAGKAQLTWSNPIGDGKVHVFPFPCGSAAVSTRVHEGADSGSFAIATKDLVIGAPPASGQCVTIRIQRDVPGTVDPAFAPGSKLTATRYDYVNVSVVP